MFIVRDNVFRITYIVPLAVGGEREIILVSLTTTILHRVSYVRELGWPIRGFPNQYYFHYKRIRRAKCTDGGFFFFWFYRRLFSLFLWR